MMIDPSAWLRPSTRREALADRTNSDCIDSSIWSRRSIGICLLLTAATLATYAPIRNASFINFDDHVAFRYAYEQRFYM